MTQYTLINHVVHNYEKVLSDNYLLSILLYCQSELYHCHETFAKICLKIDMLIKWTQAGHLHPAPVDISSKLSCVRCDT